MFTSNAQVEFKQALQKFGEAKREEYGSYAFAAGYLESLAAEMFGLLPKKQQKFFAEQMARELSKIKEMA